MQYAASSDWLLSLSIEGFFMSLLVFNYREFTEIVTKHQRADLHPTWFSELDEEEEAFSSLLQPVLEAGERDNGEGESFQKYSQV